MRTCTRWPTPCAACSYRTGAFIGGYPLQSSSGLTRGFDLYDDKFLKRPGVIERRADEVVEPALAWIEANRSQPLFVWLHLFDPHSPYTPPPAFAAAHRESPYDGEIAYTDAALGRLFDRLRHLALFSAADHRRRRRSRRIARRARRTDAWHLSLRRHDPCPAPREVADAAAARVIDVPVELADLAPTIAHMAGAALPGVDGHDLLPLLEGAAGDSDRAAYAESYYHNVLLGWSPLRAVRTRRWKYIEAPQPELYDLQNDPAERLNVAAAHVALANGLSAALACDGRHHDS